MLKLAFIVTKLLIAYAPFFAFYGKLSPKMCAALSVSIVIMRLICLRFFMQVLYWNLCCSTICVHKVLKLYIFVTKSAMFLSSEFVV